MLPEKGKKKKEGVCLPSTSSLLLLGGLRMRLVVTSDPIPHHGKGKAFKDVPFLSSQVEEALGQPIVVLALFRGVVERRIFKVFTLVLNEIGFELS